MTLIQGISVLYRCGCTLSSDTPFRATMSNGNECMDVVKERTQYKPQRDKKVPVDKQPTLAAMKTEVDNNPKDAKGNPVVLAKDVVAYKPLQETCAIHGEGASISSAWCYDLESLPTDTMNIGVI